MGVGADFPTAFAKAQAAAGARLPRPGTVFLTVTDSDKAGDRRDRRAAARPRLLDRRHGRHGGRDRADGHPGRAAQQDRGGLAARRRLDRARRRRPRHQHADGHRGARGRLRDPPRGDRARDPVHHDDRRRDGGRARDRARRATASSRRCARCRRSTARTRAGGGLVSAGPHARAARPPAAARSSGARDVRRLRRAVGRRRRTGRRRTRGSSTCSPRPSAGAGARTSGRSCRARSPSPRRHDDGTLDFVLEDVGPGTRAAVRARAGRRALAARAARPRFAPPRDGRRPVLVGGGVGIAPLVIWQRRARRRRDRAARLPRRGARRGRGAAARARGSRPTTARSATTAWSPSCSRPSSAPTHARGLRLRAAADARGGARAVRRARRAGAARARVGDGVRVRRLLRLRGARRATATCACASTGRCSTPRRSLEVGRDGRRFCGIPLAHPIVNASGTFDAIAARRAFGDALLDDFPFAAFVSKTVTLAPRQGNPPPRLWELGAGMINSIGLPNKGLEGYLAQDLPELAAAAGAADRQRHGLVRRGRRPARARRSASATRSPRSSSTSPARTSRPGC